MKYFDFHTHAFSDYIVKKAMSKLENTSGIKPFTDGTLAGLKKKMSQLHIDNFLVLPIATKPSQQNTINNWACQIQGDGVFCCGSVHPDAHDALAELDRIKSLGLHGIKFHSEYQNFRPNEERLFPIYEKAQELGLFVVFHGGWDPLTSGEIKAKPQSFADIAGVFPKLKIIAAHMGGMKLFDDAEKYIVGKHRNIYLDTGVVAGEIQPEQLLRMIKNHGADRVLFGSDVPWDDPVNEIRMLEALPLTDSEKELIFYKNALSLCE